jgi:hypothetical protein
MYLSAFIVFLLVVEKSPCQQIIVLKFDQFFLNDDYLDLILEQTPKSPVAGLGRMPW